MLIALVLWFGRMPVASAQAPSVMLLMAPHCAEKDRTLCPKFAVKDAAHHTTAELAVGDLLDLDVALLIGDPSVRQAGSSNMVQIVRASIKYDTAVLEARSVELLSALPAPFPGEQNIDASAGIVRIGGATKGAITAADTVIARVTFRVLAAPSDTVLAFHGFSENGLGQTAVNAAGAPKGNEPGVLPPPPCLDGFIGCEEGITPLLSVEPSKLFVDVKGVSVVPVVSTAGASSSSSKGAIAASVEPGTGQTTSAGTQAPSMIPPPQPSPSSFPLLQVQNVVASTKDHEVYVGWTALPSSELRGYNVYYGTVSGRYIQRHSVPSEETSFVIRDLEPGTTYYVAVRAFNGQGLESAFSQEVSVVVGTPGSAVNPVVFDAARNAVTKRMTSKVVGDTGTADTVAVLLLLSALIGTGFAFRRQLVVRGSVDPSRQLSHA